MGIITDRDTAKNKLTSLLQPSSYPTLSTGEGGEVETLLDDNRIGSVWAQSTSYEIGDVVIPTAENRTGLRYRLASFDGEGVQSGASEPAWPIKTGSTVSDGNLIWEEDGPECDLWDIMQAAYEGWLLKQSKAVNNIDYKDASASFSASQISRHCADMAEKYKPVRFA